MGKKIQGIYLSLVGILMILAVVVAVGSHFEYKTEIAALETKVTTLSEELESVKNPVQVNYSENGYNYLAVGNSITVHKVNSYWWSERGMAASTDENDYVHLVRSGLSKQGFGEITVQPFNFYVWEVQSSDRAETFDLLDPYLSPKLKLVTIQLGENVTDHASLTKDYVELIQYIRSKCPSARVLMVDDFWSEDTSRERSLAAKQAGVPFVDLSSIRNNSEYTSRLGATVFGADDKEHIIDHEGVAKHPGDKGMQYIADGILQLI